MRGSCFGDVKLPELKYAHIFIFFFNRQQFQPFPHSKRLYLDSIWQIARKQNQTRNQVVTLWYTPSALAIHFEHHKCTAQTADLTLLPAISHS